MKKVLLTLLMPVATLSYAAPLHKKKTFTIDEQRYSHELAWQKQNARMAAKGTATMRRLVATTYEAHGVLEDSNAHIYSSGRGSTHNVNPESYYDMYSMTGTEPRNILCDTTMGWFDNGGLVWENTSVYSYDAANNTTKHFYTAAYFMMQHEGMYNSNNQLVRVTTSDTFGGTALIAKRHMFIIYDGNGKRVQDSTVMIATGTQTSKRVYYYDTAGNMVKLESYSLQGMPATLQIFYRATNTYDNQGRVITESTEYDYGNGLTNNTLDSYAYTGNAIHPIHHRSATWDNNLQMWNNNQLLEYSLNAQQQPDTYIIYRYTGQWDTVERDVYHYDVYGLMDKSNGYQYMGNGQYSSTPYDQNTLYYEEYDPATVSAIVAQSGHFVLAPNPVQNNISFKAEQGYTTLLVMNATGRVIYTDHNLQAGNKTVDVSGLPAGNYIVMLCNAEAQTRMTAKFVKQ